MLPRQITTFQNGSMLKRSLGRVQDSAGVMPADKTQGMQNVYVCMVPDFTAERIRLQQTAPTRLCNGLLTRLCCLVCFELDNRQFVFCVAVYEITATFTAREGESALTGAAATGTLTCLQATSTFHLRDIEQ